jgi:hypothetical protein
MAYTKFYACWTTSDGDAVTIGVDDLLPYVGTADSSPITSLFLSRFVRAESTVRVDEFLESEKSRFTGKSLPLKS